MSKPTAEDEEADVIVDGDDTQIYGEAQYTETDLGLEVRPAEGCEHGMAVRPDVSDNHNDTESGASQTVVEVLKTRIRELESRDQNKELYKCLICMGVYKTPVVSVCCWHVHCEECWIRTLQTKKLCPQCNMITSPLDLRRIYI